MTLHVYDAHLQVLGVGIWAFNGWARLDGMDKCPERQDKSLAPLPMCSASGVVPCDSGPSRVRPRQGSPMEGRHKGTAPWGRGCPCPHMETDAECTDALLRMSGRCSPEGAPRHVAGQLA